MKLGKPVREIEITPVRPPLPEPVRRPQKTVTPLKRNTPQHSLRPNACRSVRGRREVWLVTADLMPCLRPRRRGEAASR